jgi:hypothetical protein
VGLENVQWSGAKPAGPADPAVDCKLFCRRQNRRQCCMIKVCPGVDRLVFLPTISV